MASSYNVPSHKLKKFSNFSLAFYRKWIKLPKYRYMAASANRGRNGEKKLCVTQTRPNMFVCEQKVDAASSDLPFGGGLPGRHGPDPQSDRMSDPLLGTAGDPIAPRADKRSGRRWYMNHTAGPRHLSGLGGGGHQYIYTMLCVPVPLADGVCACLPIGMNGLKRRNYPKASCSTVKSLSAPCLPAGRSRQGGDP